jgi:hypothetical protein
MTKLIFLICFFPSVIFCQSPKQQGLQEYLIPDKGDTIHFFVYNPDSLVKTKLFLYLQGSGYYPMVNGDDENPHLSLFFRQPMPHITDKITSIDSR